MQFLIDLSSIRVIWMVGLSQQPSAFFDAWLGVPFYDFEKKLWVVLFYYVVIWSIWRVRNRFVFDENFPYWNVVLLQIKLTLGYRSKWLSQKIPFTPDSPVDNLQEARRWMSSSEVPRLQRCGVEALFQVAIYLGNY